MIDTWYDYTNQAWVRDGIYVACGHPTWFICYCYGKMHQGEKADPSLRPDYENPIPGPWDFLRLLDSP